MYTKKTVKFDRFFNMKRSTIRGSHYNHIIITWMPAQTNVLTLPLAYLVPLQP